jgi:UDP-glucose 4-epimerase
MPNKSKILLTGGAGYIGSHTAIELLGAGFGVIIVDDLSNSSQESIDRVQQITGKKITFIKGDVKNKATLTKIFQENNIGSVVHFAGLKAVGESVKQPIMYYSNNIISTLSLIETMERFNVKKILFSSSATVYGSPKTMPITETFTIGTGLTNPYGKTKYMIEEMLADLVATNKNWQVTSLRYFNPIGAHPSGQIGEDPSGIPNNLMPYISQVAVGKLKELSIFGNDYPTTDGTGVRDYIHVVDLAKAHLAAIEQPASINAYRALNVGTGQGTSVLQLVAAFEQANNMHIACKISPRRVGDIAECYADPTLAKTKLGWQPNKTLKEACQDTWRWQTNNPNGYNATN